MRVEPSEEQRRVIDADAPRIIVSASAGAGKTFVLVERYLRLLQTRETPDSLRPDHILAITFTHKAAAEMKTRIVQRLHEVGMEHDAQIAETGPIQTIHAFCQRILAENSIEAGLDPDFAIMAGADTERLREEIILEVLSEPYEDDPEVTLLLEMLAGNAVYGSSTPQAALQKAIEHALSKMRGSGVTPDDLERKYASAEATRETWHRALFEELDPRVVAEIDDTQPLGAQLFATYGQLKLARPPWLKKAGDDALSSVLTTAFMRMVLQVWRGLESAMRRRHELDFTLLEQMAVDLVHRHAGVRERLQRQYRVAFVDEAQDLNPVQYKLLTNLGIATELMVGDAQQSIYGFRLADRQLFAKRQTEAGIEALTLSRNYRSRPGILAFVDHVFSDRWGTDYQPMRESVPRATADGNVLTLNFADTPTYEDVEVWPHKDVDHQGIAEQIKMLLLEGGSSAPESATDADDPFAQMGLAQRIQRRDVCVLVRTGAQALRIHTALTRVGVEAEVIGGSERYYTRLEVRDVSNALRWLSDPHDSYAALAVLRSPFVDVSLDTFVILAKRHRGGPSVYELVLEATAHPSQSGLPEADLVKLWELRRWFDELSSHADRLSAWEVIGELYARTGFLEALGRRDEPEQLLANARKLLMLAAERPETGPREFAEMVREIQRIAHRESQASTVDDDADVVRIMTIHKSKGLEFPVVIVPETLKPDKLSEPEVAIDPRRGLIAVAFKKIPALSAAWLNHAENEREKDESWRVMYVAMTRARRRLCVVVHEKGSHHSPGGKLTSIIGWNTESPPVGLTVRRYGESVNSEP